MHIALNMRQDSSLISLHTSILTFAHTNTEKNRNWSGRWKIWHMKQKTPTNNGMEGSSSLFEENDKCKIL